MDKNPKLEPCPLPTCRGKAEFEHPITEAVIRCIKCGLTLTVSKNSMAYSDINTMMEAEKNEVITKWNDR